MKRTQRPRCVRQAKGRQPVLVLKRRIGYMCDADEGPSVSKKLNTGMSPMES